MFEQWYEWWCAKEMTALTKIRKGNVSRGFSRTQWYSSDGCWHPQQPITTKCQRTYHIGPNPEIMVIGQLMKGKFILEAPSLTFAFHLEKHSEQEPDVQSCNSHYYCPKKKTFVISDHHYDPLTSKSLLWQFLWSSLWPLVIPVMSCVPSSLINDSPITESVICWHFF